MGWVGYDKYVTQLSFLPSVESSDAGLSHIFPESKSTDGFPFLSIAGPKTKVCKGCKQSLPLERFRYHATNRSRLNNFCKSCVVAKNSPSKKLYAIRNKDKVMGGIRAWREIHPERLAVYKIRSAAKAAQYKATAKKKARELTILKQRERNPNWPNPPPCGAHGEHGDWRTNRGGQFFCNKCSKEAHGAANLRASIRNITELCGPEFAVEYSEFANEPGFLKFTGKKRIFEVKRQVFLRDFGLKINIEASKRIGLMNRIYGRGFNSLTLGWKCNHCPTEGVEHQLFDIDHIIPRAHGGTNAITNYQILCPSCHRRKSLSDNAKLRSIKLLAQDQSACQHSFVPQTSAYDQPRSETGATGPTRSLPVAGEKTSCTAAASIQGSSCSQTGNTRHTPSTFAAPTQSSYTADARRSVATPEYHGI